MNSSVADALLFRKVLEGVIHNINTPLNLVLGYVQQLQKNDPDNEQLQKIFNAGIQIDDILNDTYRSVLHRLILQKTEFDLGQWLNEEMTLLHNELAIKHQFRFELVPWQDAPKVKTSSLLLSVCFEAIILKISKLHPHKPLPATLGIKAKNQEILIRIPAADKFDVGKLEDLFGYLKGPMNLMEYQNLETRDLFRFSQESHDGLCTIRIKVY